jgi:chemotaxis protein MotB
LLKRLTTKSRYEVKTDRYLITYADLITLLLGLFVILYAASQVDETKYKEFSKAFSEYFKSTKEQVLQGGGGVLQGHRNGIPEPIMPNAAVNKTLDQIYKETEKALNEYISQSTIKISRKNNEIVLTISEKLLFQSGKADIKTEGLRALDTLSVILKGIKDQFAIEGHTDSEPIRTFRFESNWHLSVARALNVGYYLIQKGVQESNMVIRGYGSQRPVADNSSTESRALNRRVEISISELPAEAPSTEGYNKQQDTLKKK